MNKSPSDKNALQEYFQKLGKSLPKYESKKVGGEDHAPVWQSKVVLFDGSSYKGKPAESKSESDSYAARFALKRLSQFSSPSTHNSSQFSSPSTHNPPKKSSKNNLKYPSLGNFKNSKPSKKITPNKINLEMYERVCLLVDIENQQNALKILNERFGCIKWFEVYIFISKGNPLISKIKSECNEESFFVKIIEVPSTRKDAADVGLSLVAGEMIINNEYDIFIILSNDHFADPLAECMKNYDELRFSNGKLKSKNPDIEVHVYRDTQNVIEKLEELGEVI